MKHVNIYHRESSRLDAQGGRIRFTSQYSYVNNKKQYLVAKEMITFVQNN